MLRELLVPLSIIVIVFLVWLVRHFRVEVSTWLFSRQSKLREVALYFSKVIGRIRYNMQRRWIPPVVLLVATAIGVWVIQSLQNFRPQMGTGFSGVFQQFLNSPLSWLLLKLYAFITEVWAQWEIILATYTLILLLGWVLRARKRVVIEEFVDYGSEQSKEVVSGLARLLVVKLGQLRDLYQTVDEQRAIPTSVWVNQSIDATINVGDVTEFLKDAVSTQSELSLGPVKIPIGTLISLLGRFAQGPRIIGSLHKDKSLLILTAQQIDGKQSHSWRVEGSLSQPAQHINDSLNAMVDELACRMFTDLALNGSVRWRATAKFNDGLRAYRDCLRTPKERRTNLAKAEKGLVETLAEDQKFNMAYYNLGVVYTELGQTDAAEDAFLKAINQNPGSWNAFYALAVSRFQTALKEDNEFKAHQPPNEDGVYKMASMSTIELCKRVIELKPESANIAKAYQLRGLADEKLRAVTSRELKRVADQSDKGCELDKAKRNFRQDAAHCRRNAIGHSWRVLCAARLSGADRSDVQDAELMQLETLAGVCLANQAEAARDENRFEYAEKLLQRTLALTRASADYYAYYAYQLAETYYYWGNNLSASGTQTNAQKDSIKNKYHEAVKEYKRAIRTNPDKIDFRASLALAYDRLDMKQSALDECVKVLSNISQASREAREKMSEVYKSSQVQQGNADSNMRTRIQVMEDFLAVESHIREHEQDLKEGEISLADFKKELDDRLKEYTINAWGYAIVILAMGKLPPDAYTHEYMNKHYTEAVEKLKQSEEFRSQECLEWEKGQIFRILGYLHLELDKPEAAEGYFYDAIKVLERKHPQEIRLRKLPLSLAQSLLKQEKQEKYIQALQELKQALSHDSLDYDEREVLGDVYFKLDEFEEAIEAWKEAISWRNALLKEPDSADIKYKIGNANVEKAQHCLEAKRKDIALNEAIEYLKQALSLYKSDQQKKRGYTCYLLGIIHLELGKYWEAISYLKMSQALAYPRLTSIFYLGYAFLKNKEYRASVKQFEALFVEADKLNNQGKLDISLVESEPKEILSVEPITLGEFKALAYWGQAFAIVESDGDFKAARQLIELAQPLINGSTKDMPTPAQLRFPGKYPDCIGWVHYKLGTDIATVIKYLEYALAKAEDAEIYLHLALAYERQLQMSGDKACLQLAQIYCQHAQDLDIRSEYNKMTNGLQQRLLGFGHGTTLQIKRETTARHRQRRYSSLVVAGETINDPRTGTRIANRHKT